MLIINLQVFLLRAKSDFFRSNVAVSNGVSIFSVWRNSMPVFVVVVQAYIPTPSVSGFLSPESRENFCSWIDMQRPRISNAWIASCLQ